MGIEAFVVAVGDRTAGIIERSGEAYRGVSITDAHQREQLGLAHALLGADPYVEDESAFCSAMPCSGRTWGRSCVDGRINLQDIRGMYETSTRLVGWFSDRPYFITGSASPSFNDVEAFAVSLHYNDPARYSGGCRCG